MLKKLLLSFTKKYRIKNKIEKELTVPQLEIFNALTNKESKLSKKLNCYQKRTFSHLDKHMFLPLFVDMYLVTAKVTNINPMKDENIFFREIFSNINKVDLELYYSLTVQPNYLDFFFTTFMDVYFNLNDPNSTNQNVVKFFRVFVKRNNIKTLYDQNLIQFNRKNFKHFFENIDSQILTKNKLDNF